MAGDYAVVGGEKLRKGYTTGSCAAAAASAAAYMLLSGREVAEVGISLPAGARTVMKLIDFELAPDKAVASVRKDGGDDADVTTGLSVVAEVKRTEVCGEVRIDGGAGVGRVTGEGLQVPVGEAAINPVPRRMITENVRRIMQSLGYEGGLSVIISVPGGEETAALTFNPLLGIVGGISIIGTTGIVEPMSEKALVDAIRVILDSRYAEEPDKVLITPGNYGADFCSRELGLDLDRAVQISNFVGEALDYIRYKGFRRVLLVGHTGKLVKTAAGVMNTHSRCADGRMEIIAAHSAMYGAEAATVRAIMQCLTTDAAFDLISEHPWYEDVKRSILGRAVTNLERRLRGTAQIEVIMFTTDRRHMLASGGALAMAAEFRGGR